MQGVFRKYIKNTGVQIFVVLFTFISFTQTSCKTCFTIIKVENDTDFYKKEGIPIERGKCFGKSRFRDSYVYKEEVVAVYTRDDFEVKGLKFREYLVKPEVLKWTWMKPQNGSFSDDSNFDSVWLWDKEPAIIEEFYQVIDTNQIRHFQYETISIAKKDKEQYDNWIEVVCKEDMTKNFIKSVQNALDKRGFGHKININGRLCKETYKALGMFQFNNDLPIGNLDFESLKLLGVEF